jgi:hypothetical protein
MGVHVGRGPEVGVWWLGVAVQVGAGVTWLGGGVGGGGWGGGGVGVGGGGGSRVVVSQLDLVRCEITFRNHNRTLGTVS